MEEIRLWIEMEGAGHYYFYAFPACLLCLFIWFRNRRVHFLVPCSIILVALVNPIFSRKWNDIGLYAYWRILWVIPVIPVLASLIPGINEKVSRKWLKAVIVIVGVLLIVLGGTFLYVGPRGDFYETANTAKLPDHVVKIADKLLDLDDHPRIIAQDPIGVYIRQYTGEIDTLYGRDLHGYIADLSSSAKKASKALDSGDLDTVNQIMLDESYDFLIYNGNPGENFELVDVIDNYGIYKAIGIPSVRQERNSLGQITSITTLDENGLPQNGINGYATLKQDLDTFGNVIREQYLDADGQFVDTAAGYAEKRCQRNDNGKITKAEYFDRKGNPCTLKDGYTAFIQTWNGLDPVERVYLGADGDSINRIDGYSRIRWEKDQYGTNNARYFNKQGNEVNIDGINLIRDHEIGEDGWSMWISPDYNTKNSCFTVGTANLGEKKRGDIFTCDIEIEFKDVQASDEGFWFRTQGAVDGTWEVYNIWNNVIVLEEVPQDGVYKYHASYALKDNMAKASEFTIAFRCDSWKSGSFRIRNLSIRKMTSGQEGNR